MNTKNIHSKKMSSFLIGTKRDQLVLRQNSDDCTTILSFRSQKGKLTVDSTPYDNTLFSTEYECYGIIGVYKMVHRLYLAFIEKCKSVGIGAKGGEIFQIQQIKVLPIPNDDHIYIDDELDCDHKLVDMIYESYSIDNFYFSFTENISKKLQDQGPGARVYDRQYPEDMDSYFVYNYHVIEELKDFKSMFFDHLITPVIHGYLDIQEGCTINSTVFKLILISRRSYNNIGRRYTTRGLDEDANAANFVETEQILVRRNGEVSSYVQIRGSIPLKWSQTPTLKYTPKNDILFTKHMEMLEDRYSTILCVNLVDKKGSQKRLGDAYERAILKAHNPKYGIVPMVK